MTPKNSDAKLLKTGYVLFFGKYKGKKVSEVIESDPSWVLWAQDNVPFIVFDEEVIKKAKAKLSKPLFTVDAAALEQHAEMLQGIEGGLDSYGTGGIRELHGFTDDANIHQSLNYFHVLGKYLAAEIKAGTELGKLLTQTLG